MNYEYLMTLRMQEVEIVLGEPAMSTHHVHSDGHGVLLFLPQQISPVSMATK